LRDYGVEGQLGLEETPEEYVERLVEIFSEVRRVLRGDGTVFLNLGDSYYGGKGASNYNFQKRRESGNLHGDQHNIEATIGGMRPLDAPQDGLKPKDLVGIPWRVAFALQADGWWLRSDIIWSKPNPMPESVRDRPTKSHEYIFLLSKSKTYYYDHEAIKEPFESAEEHAKRKRIVASHGDSEESSTGMAGGHNMLGDPEKGKNKRSVWTVATKPYREAHFATFPQDLIRPCVLAGCPAGGTVLDPFFGAGTTGLVSKQEARGYIGIELNPEYVEMARQRINGECPMERLI